MPDAPEPNEDLNEIIHALREALESGDVAGGDLSAREISALLHDIAHLKEVVLEGNGRPSLRQEVAVIAQTQKTLKTDVQTLSHKMDQHKNDMRSYIAWGLGIIGTIISILTLFGDYLLT